MITKILFNTDKKLKDAVQKKARKQGLTISAVFNLAAEAYIHDRLQISAFEAQLARAREDVRRGRFYTQEEVLKKLGL